MRLCVYAFKRLSVYGRCIELVEMFKGLRFKGLRFKGLCVYAFMRLCVYRRFKGFRAMH